MPPETDQRRALPLRLDAVGRPIGPIRRTYGWKDVALYAVGVGAGFEELEYCYEERLKVLPSFSAASIFDMFFLVARQANANPAGILHGEQRLILHRPIPVEGTLTTSGRITHIYDKGSRTGALIVADTETWHSDGSRLFNATFGLFSRLDGGFGGENAPPNTATIPEREPDLEIPDTPGTNQPLLYRLSGDTFRLHVDPAFARAAGFDRPIMHGLCTQGYACRAVVKALMPDAPDRLQRFDCRFAGILYPGTPIRTQIWKTGPGEAAWRVVSGETGELVIDHGVAVYAETGSG